MSGRKRYVCANGEKQLGLRASLALWSEDEPRAVSLAEEALGTTAGAARGHYTLGWVAVRGGRFEDAERHFTGATLADPRVAPYHRCTMAAVHFRGHYDRALELGRGLHAIEPEQPYVLGYYVETLNAMGRFSETIAVTDAAPEAAKNFTVMAALTGFFQLMTPVFGLAAVLTVLVDGLLQVLFGLCFLLLLAATILYLGFLDRAITFDEAGLANPPYMLLHYGRNTHHISEAIFKGLARAIRAAAEPDPRSSDIPSTKGIL